MHEIVKTYIDNRLEAIEKKLALGFSPTALMPLKDELYEEAMELECLTEAAQIRYIKDQENKQ